MINTMILGIGLLYLVMPSSPSHEEVLNVPPRSYELISCGDPRLDELNVDPAVRRALCRLEVKQ